MPTDPAIEALQQRIAVLEAELARLQPIGAAAQEAYAFFAGRRPGFAASYGRDVLVAAFEPSGTRRTKKRGSTRRRNSS
ncbi:MAG TPA: hypothetical protein VFU22_14535 [Roseiflexaceae bacterium]|nr:hypothetical protein [Roseiflexaceae bacterium]